MKVNFLIGIVVFYSCSGTIKSDRKVEVEQVEKTANKPYYNWMEPFVITDSKTVNSKEDLYGYWVGDFTAVEPGKTVKMNQSDLLPRLINLAIDSLGQDSIYGHSIVIGNRRPFRGTYTYHDKAYWFVVEEPGDDKYDGKFEFAIYEGDSLLKGHWQANKELKVSQRTFVLKKRKFTYDPNNQLEDIFEDMTNTKKLKIYDYDAQETYYEESMLTSTELIFEYNPSVNVLKKSELEELSKGDIIVLRNSIYAKHGYAFKSKALRSYFENLKWYFPVYTDIKNQLSKVEKENIQLLLKYEKHAEAYYDYYGR